VINQIADGRKHFVFRVRGQRHSRKLARQRWHAVDSAVRLLEGRIGYKIAATEWRVTALLEGEYSEFGLKMLGLIRPDSPESIQS
jgi:hypothetical protein